jgi:N-acetyl-beta-hexosaminidase
MKLLDMALNTLRRVDNDTDISFRLRNTLNQCTPIHWSIIGTVIDQVEDVFSLRYA